ncbi:hypothetical protein [Dyella lutea]|uniref:Uncharacterized protein n=1 Tax=Dyella lutea TaxID=2950441 RepID=A0ABT1FF68_9GAMM|nr:hypothetical protein [Dyella lutea]MCP1376026.1 hypothetical protein [Dyella lutea]
MITSPPYPPTFGPKNPADVGLILEVDCTKLLATLAEPNAKIATVQGVSASPSDVQLGTPSPTSDALKIRVPSTGGTLGQVYLLAFTFTTTGGQTLTRSAYLPVRTI